MGHPVTARFYDEPRPVRVGPGYRWLGMPWALAKARKATTCAVSDLPIAVGDEVYRPLSNGLHRMLRVLRAEMERPTSPEPNPDKGEASK